MSLRVYTIHASYEAYVKDRMFLKHPIFESRFVRSFPFKIEMHPSECNKLIRMTPEKCRRVQMLLQASK